MTLSGRVDTLENQVTYITQDLLQKIDLSTSSTRSTQMNQQLDTIENSVDVLTTQLRTLQSLYTNLYLTVRNNYSDFTGHTGDPDTDITALSEAVSGLNVTVSGLDVTVTSLDPEYAAMYQTGATIYNISSELVDTFIGSVGATGSVSKDIDIQLYGSIGANDPPQDQFIVNADGVYRFTATFAMKADDIPGGNTTTIDSAIATGTASGIVPGSDFQFDLTDNASATSRTVAITKMMNLASGQNVMLVGKANRECDLSIQTSLMNLEKVHET